MKVYLKNGDVIEGELTFFNYDEQVIHMKDYEVQRTGKVVESGAFWVVNSRSWHNLAIQKVKTNERIDKEN